MLQPFSLNHLDETQFEEFCYELLKQLGFTNIKWRKGTGLSSSPSDRGRDIECDLVREDFDGSTYVERWFVECKHYVKGVAPDKIQGAIAWATAKRPDKLLIIASNFLSNPTTDFIKEYVRENRPSFRIKVWERPDLERLTAGRTGLLQRYGIDTSFLYFSSLHPNHIIYLRYRSLNTLNHLFQALSLLDEENKSETLRRICFHINLEEDINNNGEALVSEDHLRRKCHQLRQFTSESFLVDAIVLNVLQDIKNQLDGPSVEEQIANLDSLFLHPDNIKYVSEQKLQQIAQGFHDVEWVESVLTKDEMLDIAHKFVSAETQRIREENKRYSVLYTQFCEKVLDFLLKQELF